MLHEQRIISSDDAPTLADLFNERCLRSPNGLAYVQYRDGDWREYSWEATRAAVARWQAAMLADGLRPGERVAIMCSNRWEWVVCDQAAQGLGLVTVPVYTNDRADNLAWILADAGASLLMLETRAQWASLADRHDLPASLRRVVCLQDGVDGGDTVVALRDWLSDGSPPYRCRPREPDSLATIIYTSGTTGRPKGVMLSHRNILFNVQAALRLFDVFEQDLMLSFLPLSHAFERTVGYYLPMSTGTAIAYNRSIPQLAEDLAAIQPTLMISVPRIFERVYAKLMDKLATEPLLKRRLFHMAVRIGWARFLYRQGRGPWRPELLLFRPLDLMVGRKVRAKLGGRLRFTVCGGAALAPEVARLFIGLGIPVVQGYGLTETSPIISANPLRDNQPASVGLPLPGIEVRVGAGGELLTRSRSVMLGYWNNAEATRETIDADGWLHTGDKAWITPTGHVQITGRLKDIIVLSNGEKVPPSDMENAIVLDALVDQVMVIGEGRPYLSALVVPNLEGIAEIAPIVHLDPANEETWSDENIHSLLMQHVQRRTAAFPGYAQVRRLAVVAEPWTPDNGLATPTLKLRRNEILKRYHRLAEQLYAGH
jgi:long-chain acyl-CoA synthetase